MGSKYFYLLLSFLGLFVVLMIVGLNKNPDYVPSQLVGKPAPQFSLQTHEEKMFDSNSVIGNGKTWVVLNFWSSTCIICKKEAVELEAFYQRYIFQNKLLEDKIALISVNIQDSLEDILEWRQDYGLSFPIVLDADGHVSLEYGVTGTPETFFVNPEGVVRLRMTGRMDSDRVIDVIRYLQRNNDISEDSLLQNIGSI